MIPYIGDFILGQTLHIPHNTFAAAGESITRATNGSIKVFKGSSVTQRTSSNGITDTEDHDSDTGTHLASIDTSDNTDSGFYAPGNDYFVKITGETIDGKSINRWIGHFSIENRGLVHSYYEAVASGGSTTYADLPSGANTTDDHYNDAFVVITHASGAKEYAYASDYVGSTTRRLSLNKTLQAAVASGDRVQIFPGAKASIIGEVDASVTKIGGDSAAATAFQRGVAHVLSFTLTGTPSTTVWDVTGLPTLGNMANLNGRDVYMRTGTLNEWRGKISSISDQGSGVYRITLVSASPAAPSSGNQGEVI